MRAWPSGFATQAPWTQGQRSSPLPFPFAFLTSSNVPSSFQPTSIKTPWYSWPHNDGGWGGCPSATFDQASGALQRVSGSDPKAWCKGEVWQSPAVGRTSYSTFQSKSFYHTYHSGRPISGAMPSPLLDQTKFFYLV